MSNVVGYSSRGTVSNSSVGSGGGGGDVEDILKRMGNVETHVSELRTQVSAILAVIPHLATKADVAAVHLPMKADVAGVHLAMKADIAGVQADVADVRAAVGQVKADVAAAETAIIKWIVATVLASAALAFTIAKFVH